MLFEINKDRPSELKAGLFNCIFSFMEKLIAGVCVFMDRNYPFDK
jgi:hypothetical protein